MGADLGWAESGAQAPTGRVPRPRPREAVGEGVLYRNDRTTISRVPGPQGSGSVIRKEIHGAGAAERLAHEAAVLGRLAGVAGVPRLVGETAGVSRALLFEDVGGEALAELLVAGRPGGPRWLEVTLDLAVDLARVVADLHRRGVVHKDINPANVVISGEGTPLVIDFDLATTFAEERPEFTHQSEISGTLPYLAPEQSGRTGRPVDHRADIYALGATLYEVLTGRPPFENDDPLGLIHDHLARVPVPPTERDPDIPRALSDVVMRLLEKEPDRRYQSADGLAHDLALLRDREQRGTLEAPFAPGERDFPLRLAPPSRLFGRELEIATLAAAFDDAVAGECRAVLVAGEPGTGKTALIDELRTVVTAAGGWYVTGKFDRYRQDRAADGVNQALASLGRLLLAEPEDALVAHRSRLRAILGPNTGLVASMSPEFALLLELAPEPPTGEPHEIKARLIRCGLSLLRAVASPARPVVMVLDDLQWAASTPLDLVDTLLAADELPGLLLVAAYRPAEVDGTHPLTARMRRWERLGVLPATLRLTDLPARDLGELLADMLRLPPDRAAQLAEAVMTRTGGNPFDTVELVNALRRDGVLVLGDDGWRWDPDEIRRHIGSGEILDIIAARLDGLPASSTTVLEVMACLGGVVDLALLRSATGLPEHELEGVLAPALESGLLVMAAGGEAVRFRHDRIQEAAYGILDGVARGALHLRLARTLASLPHLATMAAEQYLYAVDAVQEPDERYRVATLFREAGRRSLVLNPGLAEGFFEAGAVLLGACGATDDDPLLIEVEDGWHEALVSVGRLEDADEVYQAIERRRPEPLSRVSPACSQISSLAGRGRAADAWQCGAQLLRQLGVSVPDDGRMADEIRHGLDGLRTWVEARGEEEERGGRCDAPPRAVAAARLLSRLMSPVLLAKPELLPWLVIAAWRLWVEHGPTPALVDPLSHAGFVTIAARDDYRTGHHVVQRVIAVSEGHGYGPETVQARFTYVLSMSHWFEPLEDVVEQIRAVHERLGEAGDLQNAPYFPTVLLPPLLDCSPSVDTFAVDVGAGLALARRLCHEPVGDIVTAFRRLCLALRGETAGPGSFTDASFDEEAFLGRLLDGAAAGGVRGPYTVLRALSAAIFGQDDDLDRYAGMAAQALPTLAGLYWGSAGHVVHGLALARRARTVGGDERPGLLRELDGVRDWLARRAEDSPGTFRHLATWIGAERSWAAGDVAAAVAAFDSTLGDVQHRQRPWQRALITERAGLLHLEHGLEHTGRILLHGARDCYQAWGASAKVAQLERDHPFLRDPAEHPAVAHRTHAHVTVAPGRTLGRHGTLAVSSRSIDLMAVLKASQALSSETNLERLRARVVEVLSALTGATTVRLLLWNDDTLKWYLPPGAGGEAATSLEDAAASALLPVSAFRYAERTREPLLVEDAARDDRFRRDPYLAGADRCSLLVVPVVTHGALRAMLLLENRLSGGVFTADRLDTVVLIAGQLAVSIDNALAERFRSLVQRSSDLTLVCDRDGVMSYVSAAATDVLGLDEAALTGRALSQLVHPDDRAGVERRVRAPGAGDAQALEFRVLGGAERTDGAARWVQATFTDLLADPAVGGVVVHLRDVTERHQLETELRHAQKLESVGQLAAGIAHEINTPIQFVGDNVQFLSDAFGDLSRVLRAYQEVAAQPDPVPELAAAGRLAEEIDTDYLLAEIPSAIEQTRDGVSRVSTIVRAMKAFGHPSGDSKALSDLNEAIRSTLVVAGSELKYVADVVTELGDLPPVWCNLGDVNQVVLNLVVNAAHAVGEAMRRGRGRGTITVRSRCEGEEVVVEVADTGAGIPPEIADRVFEQFFTTKAVGTGTGQGLALAYALVHDRHGGTIGFTSEPGAGTTFTIRLPYHQP